jgi:hypothetical protein
MQDSLQEINDYLTLLRKQTDEEIAELSRRSLAAQAAARVMPTSDGPPVTMTEPMLRSNMTGGRQPRRDGNSFARVAPTPEWQTPGGAHAKRKENPGDD